LRGRPLWGCPCSWVRACCFGAVCSCSRGHKTEV